MSTRAQVRFATRESGVSFSEHPDKIHAQFYVHHDGYPEGLGLDIANSILGGHGINEMEIEELQDQHSDLEYIYYVWQKYDGDTMISIFAINSIQHHCHECGSELMTTDKCIFVGLPKDLLEKYTLNTNEKG